MRYAVILAGGSGTRLWPMSRASMPKQMLPFINGRSLLEHSWERLEGLIDRENRLVCASEDQRAMIAQSLGGLGSAQFLGEPEGRDTLAAIGYSAAIVARRDPEATIGVFTADHIIEPVEKFREIVAEGYGLAEQEKNALVTFGITPSRAATSYGYLSLGAVARDQARVVEQFREKPDRGTAERWLAEGPSRFLWNSGMFVWKASVFLDCVQRYEPDTRAGLARIADAWGTAEFPAVIGSVYPSLRKISVDFAVMEKASRDSRVRVLAIPMDLSWLDIGSWPAFAETCRTDGAGNAVAAEASLLVDTRSTLVASSDPQHLVATLGCEDLVVIHTPDATLVCRRDRSEDVKKLQAMVAERFGGRFV
ncbi:MAG TPA: mannose-1-phosphate guanylyltransferase [Spirochaetia bacterium]|nr:mannose-1-phosphate guanylyltransferase [Spirochaetia bacterium]